MQKGFYATFHAQNATYRREEFRRGTKIWHIISIIEFFLCFIQKEGEKQEKKKKERWDYITVTCIPGVSTVRPAFVSCCNYSNVRTHYGQGLGRMVIR